MLTYAEGAVTKNASEKKINSLLDFMAGASDMQVTRGLNIALQHVMPSPCLLIS